VKIVVHSLRFLEKMLNSDSDFKTFFSIDGAQTVVDVMSNYRDKMIVVLTGIEILQRIAATDEGIGDLISLTTVATLVDIMHHFKATYYIRKHRIVLFATVRLLVLLLALGTKLKVIDKPLTDEANAEIAALAIDMSVTSHLSDTTASEANHHASARKQICFGWTRSYANFQVAIKSQTPKVITIK